MVDTRVLWAAGMLPGYREPDYFLCVTKCAAACCRAPGFVLLTTPEMRTFKALDRDVKVLTIEGRPGWWIMDFGNQKAKMCPFLESETSLCTIYHERPQGCRQYPQRPMDKCMAWWETADMQKLLGG